MGESCYSVTAEGVVLNVKAAPRSSKSGLGGVMGDAMKVHLHSAPVDGKANAELQATLSKVFKLAKRDVEILAGDTSKTKRVLLKGLTEVSFKQIAGV